MVLCGGFSAEVRAKKMRQDDCTEFISASLDRGAFFAVIEMLQIGFVRQSGLSLLLCFCKNFTELCGIRKSSDFDTIAVHVPLRFRRHRWLSFLLR